MFIWILYEEEEF